MQPQFAHSYTHPAYATVQTTSVHGTNATTTTAWSSNHPTPWAANPPLGPHNIPSPSTVHFSGQPSAPHGGAFAHHTTSSSANATPPTWAAPNANIPSGLCLRPVARPDIYADYERDRVIVSRHQRGATNKDRAKIRELCTESITPKITRGNITKLLSSSNNENYDIAVDAAQWQTALGNIWNHIVQYNFVHIAMIPRSFDPTNANLVTSNSIFVNAVLNHDELTDDHYFSWQILLRRFGRDEELISDSWLEDKLWKSLEVDLRAEVKSDFDELPTLQKGAISLLRLIINRMVQNSQESRRAMEEFIKTFDIQKFPGEDVTKASLRIKAVAQSLGTSRLPSDIVHRVLEGFARSSTPAFSNLCHHQESMISSSLVKANLRQDSLYKTLIAVLSDLEMKYGELLSGQRWLGIGHTTSFTKSTFHINADSDSDSTDT